MSDNLYTPHTVETPAQLGHSHKSLTLDTYSHVLIDQGRRELPVALA